MWAGRVVGGERGANVGGGEVGNACVLRDLVFLVVDEPVDYTNTTNQDQDTQTQGKNNGKHARISQPGQGKTAKSEKRVKTLKIPGVITLLT